MGLRIRLEIHVYIHRDDNQKKDKTTTAKAPQSVTATPPQPVAAKAPQPAGSTVADFIAAARAETERLTSVRSLSTINNYQTALRSFSRFLDGQPETMPLDGDVAKRYERWLRERHVCPNTTSCYLRSLRSLAVRLYGSVVLDCFREVYTGRNQTDKRAIEVSDMDRLRRLELKPGSFASLVRDLFLFSFYALGMPLIDIAFLRKSQIAEGCITYFRHKTGQRVVVPLAPCMWEIIERYQTGERDLVFPLLTTDDPQASQHEYLERLNRYNRTLKTLAAKSGIGHRLTSYVARHSWASMAYHADVALPVISKALGHANPQHTLTYIQEIDDRRVVEANRKILRWVQNDSQLTPNLAKN